MKFIVVSLFLVIEWLIYELFSPFDETFLKRKAREIAKKTYFMILAIRIKHHWLPKDEFNKFYNAPKNFKFFDTDEYVRAWGMILEARRIAHIDDIRGD